ncbi:MAG TPA: isoprenyl transferase [Bacteroidales bacterium]|jgi:undecaprenyl diphosphate synthase|nr:isoprenyl transferase [Bacteroidales bacterium]MDY0159860.1 isoprenyl transferase [Bacteroidales bacterium]HXK81529.1 isoprenyl transferase [Bacteroidales bacterium]
MNYLENLDKSKLPKHIAIIMDGNGRWAKQKGKNRLYGHKNGTKSVRQVIEGSIEAGIKYLTLYAFSKENWKRPSKEVEGLMNLLISSIESELEELHSNGVKLNIIGDMCRLSDKVQNKVKIAIEKTKNNKTLNLNIALSYSGRWEIVEAVKKIANDTKNGTLSIDKINEELFSDYLETAGMPDPELLIRTSGEQRISNYLLYQLAYAEFYFTPLLWPDFSKEDLYEAIFIYQNRERRFGKISEQIKN